MSETRYFEDDDGDWLYAGIGTLAIDGLLRIRTPVTSESHWEWLDRSSTAWDAAHQKIYRNFRVTRVEAMDIEKLPPLPDSPAPNLSIPVKPVFASARYPALSSMLRAAAPAPLALNVILSEDTYESFSGDGKFHDFEAIRFTEEAARAYVDSAPTYCARYYHRSLRLWLEGDVIRYELQKEVFDCCDVAGMFDAAEELAATLPQTGIG